MYAALKAAAEILGMLAVCNDLGWRLKCEVWGDASVALGIINRQGLGKTRHIDIGCLWIQQVAAQQRLKFQKVLGKENPADLFTKYLDEKTNKLHTNKLEYEFKDGRAIEAPQLHQISQSMDEYLHGGNVEDWEGLRRLCPEAHARSRAKHNQESKSLKALMRSLQKETCERVKRQTDQRGRIQDEPGWLVNGGRCLHCVTKAMKEGHINNEKDVNEKTDARRNSGSEGFTPLRRECKVVERQRHRCRGNRHAKDEHSVARESGHECWT